MKTHTHKGTNETIRDPFILSRDAIDRENCYLLKRVTICACINMTVLALISPFLGGFCESEALYIICAVLTGAFAVYCHFFADRFLRAVRPLFYCLLAGLCAYGVALCAFYYDDIPGVTIIGIYVLIPMVIIDRSVRVNIIYLCYYAAACAVILLFKPMSLAVDDCVTLGAFVIFGMLIGEYLRNARLNAIEQRALLEYQRSVDVLTDLPNRRSLFEALGRSDTGEDGAFITGAIMVDIDDFKGYNDLYGHQAGDDYLTQLGRLFNEITAAESIKFYRYGGEEFIALCVDMNADEVWRLADMLPETVRERNIRGDRRTISVGCAFRDSESISSERLINMADRALYIAKEHGRDRTVMYDDAL